MRKWYKGLSREGRMMVRVSLAFIGAISFWLFYSSSLSGSLPGILRAALISVSLVALAILLYLKQGGREGRL
ncbi:MAG: hypothetical protein PHW14_04345 [Candidatus Omnitrophica bacterium]|nr:hypothetical protein [Candidatus Omnitrophota bacterium]